MTEEQILSKLRSKDPEGLEALMDRYLPLTQSVVLSMPDPNRWFPSIL